MNEKVIERAITDEEYIENVASECIWCGSDEISGERTEFESTQAYRKIRCKNCGKEWEEVFNMVATQEVGGTL